MHGNLRIANSVLALLIVGLVSWPGSATASPKPLPQQWWFKTWGVRTHLWPLSTGRGITVAVLDTGVQADLPELRGVVLPGLNAEDGRGDGRQDLDEWGPPAGHGTAMASAIAAQGGVTGLLGVAPDAKILPVVTQSNRAYAMGIRFAADRGAQVINLSQGLPGPCPAFLQGAIAYALGKDAVILAGAGNDGNTTNFSMSPANCKGVVAVGAVDRKFKPWEETQRQPYVTVAAPGVHTPVLMRDGKLYSGSGTSDATALVSGAVALIRARHPRMTNREVVRQLIASALDIYEKGRDNRTGYGIIRPYRPLAGKAPKGTANPVFEDLDRWMKTRHSERPTMAAPARPIEDDSSSLPLLASFAAIGVGLVSVCVFGFVKSHRSRGVSAPPMPTQSGPSGFGVEPTTQPVRSPGEDPPYQPIRPARQDGRPNWDPEPPHR